MVEIYKEKFKISPFRKLIEKLFALGKKYKDEHKDLMQSLVLIIMNSLEGVQIRRNIDKFINLNLNIGCKQSTMRMFRLLEITQR